MRIISSYHDYYDSLMAYDSDRELIYNRKSEEIIYPVNHWRETTDNSQKYPFPVYRAAKGYYKDPMPVKQQIVGFCGVLYPALLFRRATDRHDIPSTVCRNVDEVDQFVQDKFHPDYYNGYKGKSRSRWGAQNTQYYVNKWFEEIESKKDAYRKTFFEDKHCPIFLSWYTKDKVSIEYNACLNHTDFVRVFNPWAAYQEISMFLGSLAVPQKEMPHISDETMAEIKGFDKHSFRKDPKK